MIDYMTALNGFRYRYYRILLWGVRFVSVLAGIVTAILSFFVLRGLLWGGGGYDVTAVFMLIIFSVVSVGMWIAASLGLRLLKEKFSSGDG